MGNENDMPIRFQMALSSNRDAFEAFLNLDEKTQSDIINESKNKVCLREMNIFVNSIAKGVENVKKL